MTEYRPVAVSTVSSRVRHDGRIGGREPGQPAGRGYLPAGHRGHVRRRALGQGTGGVGDRAEGQPADHVERVVPPGGGAVVAEEPGGRQSPDQVVVGSGDRVRDDLELTCHETD